MNKRIPEEFIQQLLNETDIAEVIGDYVRLEKRGTRHMGLCPFHHEKTPSFTVQKDKNFFYCFGCKKGGDVVTFIKEIEHLDYIETIQFLAKRLNLAIPYQDGGMEDEGAAEKQALLELYSRLTGTFSYCLKNTKEGNEAFAYLKKRGISEQIVEDFKLGYAPSPKRWLYEMLAEKAYTPEFLGISGLFSKTYPELCIFSGRLMFPILDKQGNAVAFGGRIIRGEGPKYINSPETAIYQKGKVLFGLYNAIPTIREAGSVIVVEGYMDVLAWHQAGCKNTVAPLGTALTEDHVRVICKIAKEAILSFDSDEAGKKATNRAIELLLTQNCAISVLKNTKTKDAADYLLQFGEKDLQNLSKFSITVYEYIMDELLALRASSFESALEFIFSLMRAASTSVQRDQLAQAGSKALEVDKTALLEDYSGNEAGSRRYLQKQVQPHADTKKVLTSEESKDIMILAQLATDVELFKTGRNELQSADFSNVEVRSIFICLEELFRNEALSPVAVLREIEGNPYREYFIQALEKTGDSELSRKFLEDAIKNKKIQLLEKKRAEVRRKIREFSKFPENENYSLNDLLCEQMFITNEIQQLKERQA